LVGDDVDVAGEAVERALVAVIGVGGAAHDVERGRLGVGRIDVAPQSEPRRCERQHVPELPPAQDADRAVGPERPGCGHAAGSWVGRSATASVWRWRQASSRAAKASSARDKTPAASRAALMAPARPIASVPTGTPGGICTMEKSESTPAGAFNSTGTPNTGSVVRAAVIPGRCAAPPAPAMITLNPAARAPLVKA